MAWQITDVFRFELEDAELRPDQEPFMLEAIHSAAYASNTLGLPKMCPPENVDGRITRQVPSNSEFFWLNDLTEQLVILGTF